MQRAAESSSKKTYTKREREGGRGVEGNCPILSTCYCVSACQWQWYTVSACVGKWEKWKSAQDNLT